MQRLRQEGLTTCSVVWFKRDLRLADHAALQQAALRGPFLCVYIVEPSLWAAPDVSLQHYRFIRESLTELDAALRALGGRLHMLWGECGPVLERLRLLTGFTHLFSHEETGNSLSYQRDRAVADWCRNRGVTWGEYAQFGVVRRLPSREGWQQRWDAQMQGPAIPPPDGPGLQFVALDWPGAPVPPDHQVVAGSQANPPARQRGGRSRGLALLHSFITQRSERYRGGISSPLSAPAACSRLSPYLAYGCLSLREVVQAARRPLGVEAEAAGRRQAGLRAFISRLYWHCHFIQKLESEPALEWRNLHRGYDGLREPDWNPAHFEALTSGRTGWPMVDACVAMLRETGWINFRMRAMLVSVAAYPLWLHWQPVGDWLAGQFLDYEPGIHWSQMQMQSGTTGINTTRVYNPVKQAQDHDPQGLFVRRWLPALRRVPDVWLFEPWRMPPEVQDRCGVRVGVDIPLPLVDLTAATRAAKERLHARRREPEVRAGKAAVLERHGSRALPVRRTRAQARPAANQQMGLEF